MTVLSIDLETYSEVDIKNGVGAYVDSPAFEILLLAYAFEDSPIEIVDIAQGEAIPLEVEKAIFGESDIYCSAYNAFFEICCLQKHFNKNIPLNHWYCSMVKGAMVGLPLGLESVASILNLAEKKDTAGKNLIKYFSVPCTPTKVNNGRTRNLPIHNLEKWQQFKNYCIQDVEVERTLNKYLNTFEVLNSEWELWRIDTAIMLKGVKVDIPFIKNVKKIDTEDRAYNLERLKTLTGLDNPNSVTQLKAWIENELKVEIESLDKKAIKRLIKECNNEKVLKALKLRIILAKTSVKKYDAMENSVCSDGTIKGLLQFYGANRTGRWAGRLVQVQNLPQNHLDNIGLVKEEFKTLNYEQLTLLYNQSDIQQILSELIRTSFIPSKNNKFIVSDFSAIEARVIAYLASEYWRIDVFNTHGKIYEASASQMFNVPVEEITKGSDLRQKGKIAELALGYGGGVGALISMGALDMGLAEEELQPLVNAWRQANPNIVKLWRTCEKAAIKAVNGGAVKLDNGIVFYMKNNRLCVRLPSKRELYYVQPALIDNEFNSKTLTYMGMNQTTKKWTRLETFGGKLVENIVQAYARDCLAESIRRITKLGHSIVFHVHDEVVIDAGEDETNAEEIAKVMSEPISWARGLPLSADAYECTFYMKD